MACLNCLLVMCLIPCTFILICGIIASVNVVVLRVVYLPCFGVWGIFEIVFRSIFGLIFSEKYRGGVGF